MLADENVTSAAEPGNEFTNVIFKTTEQSCCCCMNTNKIAFQKFPLNEHVDHLCTKWNFIFGNNGLTPVVVVCTDAAEAAAGAAAVQRQQHQQQLLLLQRPFPVVVICGAAAAWYATLCMCNNRQSHTKHACI